MGYYRGIMNTKVRVTLIVVVILGLVYLLGFSGFVASEYLSEAANSPERFIPLPTLDKADYNARMLALAHITIATSTATSTTASSTPPTLPISTASSTVYMPGHPWPVSTAYPEVGAILPFKRIVAYYGNFYSKGMGILGEYPEEQVISMLASSTEQWAKADPTTPTIPAIQYIAVVAQATAGREGKYILRMPDDQIDHALEMARKINGLLFIDVQVGKSTLADELPLLEKYLKLPDVHLAIDPEFSMKYGEAPGRMIGTFDAADINFAARYLAQLVRDNKLPPKVLVVHRFTEEMVTNYRDITPLPEVQIVMDMDGWGSQAKKKNTYARVIADEPVQFTGVKLFYKNDVKPPSTGLLTTTEVLNLDPSPIYIQYQ